jgi:hypothetical protein
MRNYAKDEEDKFFREMRKENLSSFKSEGK